MGGESAAPLLDRVSGGGGSSRAGEAVQREQPHGPGQPAAEARAAPQYSAAMDERRASSSQVRSLDRPADGWMRPDDPRA